MTATVTVNDSLDIILSRNHEDVVLPLRLSKSDAESIAVLVGLDGLDINANPFIDETNQSVADMQASISKILDTAAALGDDDSQLALDAVAFLNDKLESIIRSWMTKIDRMTRLDTDRNRSIMAVMEGTGFDEMVFSRH